MKYVIIGSSAAGINAAEAIRSADKAGSITMVSDEGLPLYSRCLITYLLSGAITEDRLKYREDTFFEKNSIDALLGIRAQKVQCGPKKVVLSNGKTLDFDRLLVATGSRSKKLDIPGADKRGVFGIRSLPDIKGIKAMLGDVKTAVILGGGLIGLRDAYALNACGKKTKVIVKSDRVLSQMLDGDASSLVRGRLEKNGIEVMTGLAATQVNGDDRVRGVTLDDGSIIDCQLVIVGKGVVPNTEILDSAEIKMDRGILVDKYMKTSADAVYSAGDCAQSPDMFSGESVINAIWPVAVSQGRYAGLNMTGREEAYEGSVSMNSVEFFGLPAISVGLTRPKDSGYEILVKKNSSRGSYRKVVIKDGRIVGIIMVNDIESAGVFYSLMRKKADITGIKDELLKDVFNFAKIIPVIGERPELFSEEEYLEYRI